MRVVNLIPTYNEKENITLLLETLKKIAKNNLQWQFLTLIVDDQSPDGTGKIVKRHARTDSTIHLLSGPKKGLGHALLRGYQYAINKLEAEVVVTNDADFSWHPNQTPQLLEKINQGCDVVVASRHAGSAHTKGWSLFRKINHWVANWFLSTFVAGIREVKDHTGNFRAIKVKGVLDQIPFETFLKKNQVKGFAFFPFILYELSKITDKFCEVPVDFQFRTQGKAKVSPRYFKNYLRNVLEYIRLSFAIRCDRWELS